MMNVIVALLSSLLGAGVIVGSKMLSHEIPSFTFAFFRYGIAALCLLPFVLIPKPTEKIALHDLPVILFLGFTEAVLFNLLFLSALYYSPATSIALIIATNPILMMFASALVYRHIPNSYQYIAFLISFVGTALVITEGDIASAPLKGTMGELLMLLAVAFQILYALALKKVSTRYSPQLLSAATMVSGTLFVIPCMLSTENILKILNFSVKQWSIMSFISIFGTALSFYLYSWSLQDMSTTRASLLVFSSMPLFAILLSYFILGEHVSFWQLTGGILVVSSLMIGLPHTK